MKRRPRMVMAICGSGVAVLHALVFGNQWVFGSIGAGAGDLGLGWREPFWIVDPGAVDFIYPKAAGAGWAFAADLGRCLLFALIGALVFLGAPALHRRRRGMFGAFLLGWWSAALAGLASFLVEYSAAYLLTGTTRWASSVWTAGETGLQYALAVGWLPGLAVMAAYAWSRRTLEADHDGRPWKRTLLVSSFAAVTVLLVKLAAGNAFVAEQAARQLGRTGFADGGRGSWTPVYDLVYPPWRLTPVPEDAYFRDGVLWSDTGIIAFILVFAGLTVLGLRAVNLRGPLGPFGALGAAWASAAIAGVVTGTLLVVFFGTNPSWPVLSVYLGFGVYWGWLPGLAAALGQITTRPRQRPPAPAGPMAYPGGPPPQAPWQAQGPWGPPRG